MEYNFIFRTSCVLKKSENTVQSLADSLGNLHFFFIDPYMKVTGCLSINLSVCTEGFDKPLDRYGSPLY